MKEQEAHDNTGEAANAKPPELKRALRYLSRACAVAMASLCAGCLLPEPHHPGPSLWAPGIDAAVSLTYDDTLSTQLTSAVPALDAQHFKATFFLVTAQVPEHAEQWAALAQAGHEIASHTVSHPCARASWVPAGGALEDFDEARMAAELDESIQVIQSLGVKRVASFAYPCGQTYVGSEHKDYRPLVSKRFDFARGVSPIVADPEQVNLMQVPAFDGAARYSNGLLGLVEEARQSKGWLVLVFHGVGGQHLSVDPKKHAELLSYLAAHRSNLWVAPFGEVARYVAEHRTPRTGAGP